MTTRNLIKLMLLVWLMARAATGQAAVSAEEAARLGQGLTPVGGLKAANGDGSIPEWRGASLYNDAQKNVQGHPDDAQLVELVKGLNSGDAPLFTITRANMAEHTGKLTEGQKALLQGREGYAIPVYASQRGAFYPATINEATIRNATSARLEGTDTVTGARLGYAFPIPQSGAEVIWNHKLRYRGDSLVRNNNEAIVELDGSFQLTKKLEDVFFAYGNIANPGQLEDTPIAYFLGRITAPARVAGQLALVHEKAGLGSSGRLAWIFNPGMGRITRAPSVGYDAPSPGTDGEQFNDQIDMFNGALDRYDWKLVGKKEIYIPYNSTAMNVPGTRYADFIGPKFIRPEYTRYELHRVWVVEATMREGIRHQLSRRTFYVDEDSWSIAAMDGYDGRGELWKYQEGHLITIPWVPTTTGSPEVSYDLQSGRYFMTMLHSEDEFPDFTQSFEEGYFTPNNMKRLAKRLK